MTCKAGVQTWLALCLLKNSTYQEIAEVADRLEGHGYRVYSGDHDR
jgi:hypothetical protein